MFDLQAPPAMHAIRPIDQLGDASLVYMTDVRAEHRNYRRHDDGRGSGNRRRVARVDAGRARCGAGCRRGRDVPADAQHAGRCNSHRVAGIWEAQDSTRPTGRRNPDTRCRTRSCSCEQDYLSQLEPLLDVKVRTATWQLILNERKVRPSARRAITRRASTGRRRSCPAIFRMHA